MRAGHEPPKSSIVVLDTTEFLRSPQLSSQAWERLLTLSRERRLQLCVPEGVLREAERQFHLGLSREIEKLENVARKLGAWSEEAKRIADRAHADVKRSVDVGAMVGAIRQRLVLNMVETLPLPQTTIEDVLGRDLSARRPFDETGRGFRDTLNWLSVVEYVDAHGVDEIILISGDSGDFSQAKAKPPTPHADLFDDLAQFDQDVALSLYESIKSFLASAHPTQLQMAQQVVESNPTASEVDEPTLREVLTDAIISWVDNEMPFTEIGDEEEIRFEWDAQAGIPLKVTDLTITGAYVDRDSVDMQQYDAYEGGAALLRVEAEVELSLEGFMFKPDWYSLRADAPVDLIDPDWNDHMVEVATSADCKVVFDVLADEEMASIQDLSFAELLAR